MAVLTVTYGTMSGSGPNGSPMPIFRARSINHSEDIVIGPTSTQGTLTASEEFDRNVVELHAFAACYFKVGASPVAAAGSCQSMSAGETRHIYCKNGDSVACVEA